MPVESVLPVNTSSAVTLPLSRSCDDDLSVVWSSREKVYEGPSLEKEKQSRQRADAPAAILCENGSHFFFYRQGFVLGQVWEEHHDLGDP